MGAILSSIWSLLYGKKPYKIVMVGLDAGGKTTILYKLKLGKVVQTIPTIGFNVETVECNNVSFTVWDVQSGDKIRPLWRHYLQEHSGLIYVVDSTDKDRLQESRYELQRLMTYPELAGCPVLVLANKQDLPEAASPSDIIEAFEMEKLTCPWSVQGTSAITSEGIYEALDWLAQEVAKR